MKATIEGTPLHPVVVLSFPFTARHAATGELLRDWCKSLPHARFVDDAWRVTGFGSDPDGMLLAAGFTLDFSASAFAAPAATLHGDGTGGKALLLPRLSPKAAVEAHLPPGSAWSDEHSGWLVDAAALVPAGTPVPWCVVGKTIVEWAGVHASDQGTSTTSLVSNPLRFDGTVDGLRGIPVTDLRAVTHGVGKAMNATGIHSIFDLLHSVPIRYLDWSNPTPVSAAEEGETVAILGTITKVVPPPRPGGLLKATFRDAHGTFVFAKWFHGDHVARRLRTGATALLLGKIERFTFGDGRRGHAMANPLMEVVPDDTTAGNVVGIYRQSGKHGLSTWQVHRAAVEAIERIPNLIDPVPVDTVTARGMLSRLDAYRAVHAPESIAQAKDGRDRIAYDELLRLQLVLAAAAAEVAAEPAFAHDRAGRKLVHAFIAGLPYPLTGAQRRCLNEIARDMEADRPMHRLLMGDVGSGKTVEIIGAAVHAVASGGQAAIIAPTEVLALQHFEETQAHLARLSKPTGGPVTLALVTNKTVTLVPEPDGEKKLTRKQVLAAVADGDVDVIIGTHAVLSDNVTFKNLTVAIIDEQHRFGVAQRKALRDKGNGRYVDTLYASATPIPRTAVMTSFGDLAVSTLDEYPPGRSPITTVRVDEAPLTISAATPWQAIRDQVAQGRQAFVITPLVASSQAKEALAAHDVAQTLADGALAGLKVGVVTGKDHPFERKQVMGAFERGQLDVLVATTVIEVGINVPNATVITILGADRFGLAQLHQLRGRVGRGQWPGTCFLIPDKTGKVAMERLDALVDHTDGFVLAELDAASRGIGHITGSVQAGTGRDLLVADVVKDGDLVQAAKQDAAAITVGDPTLARHPMLRHEIVEALDAEATENLKSA